MIYRDFVLRLSISLNFQLFIYFVLIINKINKFYHLSVIQPYDSIMQIDNFCYNITLLFYKKY